MMLLLCVKATNTNTVNQRLKLNQREIDRTEQFQAAQSSSTVPHVAFLVRDVKEKKPREEGGNGAGMHVCKEHARYGAHLRRGKGIDARNVNCTDESERRCGAT
ncbi:uncharacterized protein LOC143899689 [Temnothorax americanus]|uniref:uncharacterized protein LOC143899689 n=1 Tax=Temnothorax americanus TaxID=1964332 RepID=UPI0040696C59